MSVSIENKTSDNNLWCIYDHLNSGIRKGGLDGPGLNIGRPLASCTPFVLLTSEKDNMIYKTNDLLLNLKKISTHLFLIILKIKILEVSMY